VSVYSLWYWYNDKVDAITRDLAGSKFELTKYWYYGKFSDGKSPIPKSARVLYRHRVDLQALFADPFEEEFLRWSRVHGT
jgi:hypothetical protein